MTALVGFFLRNRWSMSTWGKAVTLLSLTAPSLLPLDTATAGATTFTVSGRVDCSNFLDPNRLEQPSVNFVMSVSNQCWFVRITPLAKDGFEYQEAAFDGHTLYHLFRTDLRDIPAVKNLPPGSYSVATASMYHNQRVVYDVFGHHIAPLWLMFASSEYFRSLTNNLAEPAVLLGLFEAQDFWKNPFRIPVRWTLQDASPRLPIEVVYFDDGEIKQDPPFPSKKRPAPLDKGFTNVIFRVTQTARFAGFEVPTEAEVDTYKPSRGGLPPLRRFFHYRVAVHDWRPTIAATEFKPKLPGRTTISDRRLYSMVDSFTYRATNDWPTLQKVTNLAAFKKEAQVTKTSRALVAAQMSGYGRKSLFARVTVAIVLLGPLAFIVLKRITNKRKEDRLL